MTFAIFAALGVVTVRGGRLGQEAFGTRHIAICDLVLKICKITFSPLIASFSANILIVGTHKTPSNCSHFILT